MVKKFSKVTLFLLLISFSGFYLGSLFAEIVLPHTKCAEDLRCIQNSSMGDKIRQAIEDNKPSECPESQIYVCDLISMCMDGPCPWNDCRCVDKEVYEGEEND